MVDNQTKHSIPFVSNVYKSNSNANIEPSLMASLVKTYVEDDSCSLGEHQLVDPWYSDDSSSLGEHRLVDLDLL